MTLGYGNSRESDIWSLGILTCQMLSQTLPHVSTCENIYSQIRTTNPYQQHALLQTMKFFFSSIRTQPSYFRNHLTPYLNTIHGSLLSKCIDFMLCFDKSLRKSAVQILNFILSDRSYQERFIQEFNIVDCCGECLNLSSIYDCESIIRSEYSKKKSCSSLIQYGEKRYFRHEENTCCNFRIRLFTDWQYWFCFNFDFEPKFSEFLMNFLMPLIGATDHEDLLLLKFDEESRTFLERVPQKFDSLCISSYYCFLADDLFISNTLHWNWLIINASLY